MKFHCVKMEFYDNGKVLACITSSEKRGKSYHRNISGMTAFQMWFTSESTANKVLESVNDGTIGCDDVLSVWSDWEDYENKNFYKGAVA